MGEGMLVKRPSGRDRPGMKGGSDMLERIRPILMALTLFMASLAAGCAVNQGDIRGFNLISVEEEKQLGAKFAVEIEKQHQVFNDPEVQSYVNRVGNRLLTGIRQKDFDYTFKVVKNDTINAFAIPAGHVYVHTGLLKASASETELASVIAHEINHDVARHGTRQLTQQYGYSIVLQMLLGQNPNMLAQLAASLFGQAGMMSYSRSMESQADFLGVETMYRSGYNPEGMVAFFGKLQSMEKQAPGTISKYFSSHPPTSERIASVKQEIAKLPQRSWVPEYSADYKRIKAKLGQTR
jgi:predicted Zn-dependent protease